MQFDAAQLRDASRRGADGAKARESESVVKGIATVDGIVDSRALDGALSLRLGDKDVTWDAVVVHRPRHCDVIPVIRLPDEATAIGAFATCELVSIGRKGWWGC